MLHHLMKAFLPIMVYAELFFTLFSFTMKRKLENILKSKHLMLKMNSQVIVFYENFQITYNMYSLALV